jgi:hypothetical protein
VDTAPDNAETVARLIRRRLAAGPVEMRVSGSSMRGAIASGSTVRLVASRTPRRGEIWAFVANDNAVVVHRVRDVDLDTITCRGVGNPVDDDPVPLDHALGRVSHATDPDGRQRRFGGADRSRARAEFAFRRWMRRFR